MQFRPLPLFSAYIIEPSVHRDERGYFYRFYCKEEFAAIGHEGEWMQMNHSFTTYKGTVRGFHYQLPPHTEIKLVRCIAGKIFDVIIDLREDSKTFLQYAAVELSAENRNMLYIPRGFAHGFQALSDGCELIYLHSAYYVPEVEAGIRFDDPQIHIDWPLTVAHVSERDWRHPLLPQNFKGIKL
jgi:dTDP-4-dehydrorhamnose 3,5-epimerase